MTNRAALLHPEPNRFHRIELRGEGQVAKWSSVMFAGGLSFVPRTPTSLIRGQQNMLDPGAIAYHPLEELLERLGGKAECD